MTADDIADDEKKIKTYHRIAEAFKYAYSQRTKEGDPDFLEAGHMEKVSHTHRWENIFFL